MTEFPKIKVKDTASSFYDADSVTMLELASQLYGKMNEIITAFNALVDSVNKTVTEFTSGTDERLETFETALRQEFQDFIDVVDLKLKEGG